MLHQIAEIKAKVDAARQTVICHPDNYPSLQALLEHHGVSYLITLRSSALMPVDQLYVFHDDFTQFSPTCSAHNARRCSSCWPVEPLRLDDV